MSKPYTYKTIGEEMWKKTEKTSGELFVLTYGSIVSRLVQDNSGDMDMVNQKLDKIGYNIGIRLVDDFFAKTMLIKCGDFRDTIEMICQVGFKMYLGIVPKSIFLSETEALIEFDDENKNILTDFVYLDETTKDLNYSQIYCGVIRGSLAMIQVQVECRIHNELLVTGNPTQIQVRWVGRHEDHSAPYSI